MDNTANTSRSRSVPRKKAWAPKTKNGCLTCRIRRVKCDESKPSCKRCTSTGRTCDGYGRSVTPPLLPSPSLLSGTERERESFHFYQLYTAGDLAGVFDSEFFSRGVLQASHVVPAVRHTLTALGAMHRKFVASGMTAVPYDSYDTFALEQCNLAIGQVVQNYSNSASPSNSMTGLTVCILLTMFASIQGHQSEAIAHIRSGLTLLGELQADQNGLYATDPAYPVSLDSVRVMFTSLDLQARAMLPDDALCEWAPHPAARSRRAPQVFASCTEAYIFFETAFINFLSFLHRLDVSPPPSESLGVVMTEFQLIASEFAAGEAAFELFLSLPGIAPIDPLQLSSVRLLCVVKQLFLAIFALIPTQGELAWDYLESLFVRIIELSAEILGSSSVSTPDSQEEPSLSPSSSQRRPFFSFGFGVVQCLYIVASRSRSPRLRRQAIAMLFQYPRREGIWDSVIAGRIAQDAMVLEENGNRPIETAADVRNENRIRDVSINFIEARKARVEYRSFGQWQRNEGGLEREIEW